MFFEQIRNKLICQQTFAKVSHAESQLLGCTGKRISHGEENRYGNQSYYNGDVIKHCHHLLVDRFFLISVFDLNDPLISDEAEGLREEAVLAEQFRVFVD